MYIVREVVDETGYDVLVLINGRPYRAYISKQMRKSEIIDCHSNAKIWIFGSDEIDDIGQLISNIKELLDQLEIGLKYCGDD